MRGTLQVLRIAQVVYNFDNEKNKAAYNFDNEETKH